MERMLTTFLPPSRPQREDRTFVCLYPSAPRTHSPSSFPLSCSSKFSYSISEDGRSVTIKAGNRPPVLAFAIQSSRDSNLAARILNAESDSDLGCFSAPKDHWVSISAVDKPLNRNLCSNSSGPYEILNQLK